MANTKILTIRRPAAALGMVLRADVAAGALDNVTDNVKGADKLPVIAEPARAALLARNGARLG